MAGYTNTLRGALSWFRNRELLTFALMGAISAGVWAFVALGSEVLEGDTQAFDRKILLSMRNPGDTRVPLGPPWVQEAARDVTALGGVTALTFLTLATAGFLYLDGKGRMAFFLLSAVLTGVLLSIGLKDLYSRPRPQLVPHGVYVYTASFPSGHSMMSAITYLSLGALLAKSHRRRRLKIYVVSLSIVLTLSVGSAGFISVCTGRRMCLPVGPRVRSGP